MLLTLEETALLLRCCTRTVKRKIETGEIEARKFGRSWRIPALQFEDLFDVDTVMNTVAAAAAKRGL